MSGMSQYKDSQLSLLQKRIDQIKEKRKAEKKSANSQAKKAVTRLQAKYGIKKIKVLAGALK